MNSDVVIFEIETKEYVCSKNELSKASEYFQIMFTGDFAEKKMTRIKLNNTSVTSWEHIQNFMENGVIRTAFEKAGFLDEMLELLQTVNMYRFVDIEERCIDIISNAMEKNNCLKILEVSSRIDSKILIWKAKALALWHFDEIAPLDAFCRLPIGLVEECCGDSGLRCLRGERGVWSAIDKWINFSEHASTCRRQYTSRLMLCLCLNSLSSDDLSDLLLCESVKACPLISKAIESVIKERGKSDSSEGSPNTKKSKTNTEDKDSDEIYTFVQNWMQVKPRKKACSPCIIGSVYTNPDSTSPYIIKYCENENKFVPLTRLRKMESDAGTMMGYKVVSDGFKMYLVGGLIMNRQNIWNDAVWTYDPLKKSWSFFARLGKSIRHMSVCILGNHLYIMGGFGRHRVIQNEVTKLCLNNRIWTDCAPVPQNLYSTPCVAYRNRVYLIDSSVYEYVPETNVWNTVPTKPFNIGFACAVADDDYIYLAGSYNVIYKFIPSEPRENLEILGHFKFECTQACLIDGYIYSLSQEEHTDDIFCEKMNLKTGETTVLFEGKTDSIIADVTPRHRHGCFSLFTY